MKKTKVYDLPTRLFHWLFALLFLGAFIIAQTADDESSLFSFHMLAGLTMVFLLALRIIWGFIGTAYARFSSYQLNPSEMILYFKKAVFSKAKRYLGHNPASSLAAVIMFISTLGLAFTGILMAGGNETDLYKEIHELLANLFLLTVIAHILGMIIHHFRHRDLLWFSMVDGKKEAIPGKRGINSTKPVAALLLIILTLSWFGILKTRYDSDTRTLTMFGTELRLGEEEHESHTPAGEEHEEEEAYHEDDD